MKRTGRSKRENWEMAVAVVSEYLIITGIAVTVTIIFMATRGGESVYVPSAGFADSESASANLVLTRLIPNSESVLSSSYDILYIHDNNCQVFISQMDKRTTLELNYRGEERSIEIYNEMPVRIVSLPGNEWYRITTGEVVTP